jgi:hypothetical protein
MILPLRIFGWMRRVSWILDAFEDDMGDGVFGSVRDRKVDGHSSHRVKQSASFANSGKARHAIGIIQDLNVVPRDLTAPPRFECFQECLFCRKTAGIALSRCRPFAITIRAFGSREYAVAKPRSSRHGFGDAIDFNYVDAGR